MSKEKRSINYTSFDFNDKIAEMEAFLRETETFKDFQIESSNIRILMEMLAMLGSQNAFYIQAAANEVFQPTAKLYKSLNKIATTLRYNPRGKTSATLNVVGSLNPEYVFGKISQYIEIPAYSIFPSNIPTQNNENFSFTNILPIVYIVKGFGIRYLQEEDIRYKGYNLPITAHKSFFSIGNLIGLESQMFTLPLSLTKPLSIIKRNTTDGFRPFDYDRFPPSNKSDSESVGQPFVKTIFAQEYNTYLQPNIQYALILNFDTSTSKPYLYISDINSSLNDIDDDIICYFSLKHEYGDFYTLSIDELKTYNRFFVGVLGLQNLEHCKIEFDKIPNTSNSVERLKLVINKDGTRPPLSVLINGKVYTFKSGTIYSQKIPIDFWDQGVLEYNVNLAITNEHSPETNYGAQLIITSQEPLYNQVTIAKINTKFVDSYTNTPTLKVSPGKKYGDIQFVEKQTFKSTEQKAGRIYFNRGETRKKVLFDSPFTLNPNESEINYIISLTPESNVRTWYASKNERGFEIYIEPDTQFEGYVSWVVTRYKKEQTKKISVVFDKPIPQALTEDGLKTNYMVQLTPSDNVQVWYEDLKPEGFTIRTEKEFNGKISWSIFNYYGEVVPIEPESAYRQYGTVIINPEDAEIGVKVSLETPITNEQYAIQLIPNKNIVVYYNDKSSSGFTIKCEPTKEQVVVDWYVDTSSNYSYQKHGEIDFSGSTTNELQIPGMYFVNIPETFEINNLLQGDVTFTYINENTVIDPINNGLDLSIDPVRIFENSLRFIINNNKIAINTIRIFVKNENGTWDEWKQAGTGFDEDISPGNKIYMLRINENKKIQIEFGDGIVWGESPRLKEMFILGLKSVGKDGNIAKGVLSKNIVLSQYILGNQVTNISFEKQFVALLGLKSDLYFKGNDVSTQVIDSERTKLRENDLIIIQNQNAIGGNEIETVDELRQNLTNTFLRQDRNVSLLDYERYLRETFNQYIQEVKVLSYEEAVNDGLISEENKNYWFNHIFIIALNKDGSNIIPASLKNAIIDNLNGRTFSMMNIKYEIFEAKWVPIDVCIKYTKSNFGSFEQVETQIRKNIQDYFKPQNHSLGEKISHSDFIFLTKIDYVESVEVMLNKDPENKFLINDYDVMTRPSEVDINTARRNKLMSLIAKDPSLIKVYQPLFETLNSSGEREWNYSLDVSLKKYEFPKLGDIIIKRELK